MIKQKQTRFIVGLVLASGVLLMMPEIKFGDEFYGSNTMRYLTSVGSTIHDASLEGFCDPRRSLPLVEDFVMLVDRPSRVVIAGTPKGGATLSTQLMFQMLGLTKEATMYGNWIHSYREEVFDTKKDHKMVHCPTFCQTPGTVCIKLVRSPLDRVVSSYLHVMLQKRGLAEKYKKHFKELQKVIEDSNANKMDGLKTDRVVENATFADFIEALERRATSGKRSLGDNHFMPQASRSGCDGNGMRLIPIEAVEDALALLEGETGLRLKATGLTSHHYRVRKEVPGSSNDLPDISRMPAQKANSRNTTYTYEMFMQDPVLNEAICRLYCTDIKLYAQACSESSWIFSSSSSLPSKEIEEIYRTCAVEKMRVTRVCGELFGELFALKTDLSKLSAE